MEIIKFTYDKNEISFQPDSGKNLMINATEMANIFGKEVTHFLQNESTIRFIDACLNTRNSEYLNLKSREDLVIGRQKTGTWMHRILALKFAAWLNADFEVWVYSTIENLLFERFKRMEESLKASAKRKTQIETLREKLAALEDFQNLERLELEERQAAYRRGRENSAQLELFKIEA